MRWKGSDMIRVGNAPCSWGVIEGIEGERSGYERVIDEMAETGYAGTELGDWGFMPTDPARLRDELDARHLALTGSWVSVSLQDADSHERSALEAVRTAAQLARVGGPDSVVVLGNDPYADPVRSAYAGRIEPRHGMTDGQWTVFGRGANYVARRVKDETGLRTVFHQHVGTLVETLAETRHFLEITDPSLVGLCLDTGHWTFGAQGNPVDAIPEIVGRMWLVHFKDCDAAVARASRENGWDGPTSVGHGVFCELGRGQVDFPGVLAALERVGYGGWIVVEQDVLPGMGTPKESARRNREYLRSIGI
jgi:inosose dehydratase